MGDREDSLQDKVIEIVRREGSRHMRNNVVQSTVPPK